MSRSASLVNIAPVADIVEVDAALVHIEFVKHPIIGDPQLEFGAALESLVREVFQSCAHFVHLPFHVGANRCRQVVERAGEGGRPDLERGGHGSLRLARGVIAGSDFAA